MQDAGKTLLGSTESSDRYVENFNSDPATFPAGTAVRLSSGGVLSLSSGGLVGVSVGKSLSDHKKTAVCRAGSKVPVRLTDDSVKASATIQDLTYTAKVPGVAGDDITIIYVDGKEDASAEVTVTDLAISVEIEDGVTLASTIAAAIIASPAASALVDVEIDDGGEVQDAFSPAEPLAGGDDGFAYVVKGAKVSVSETTGLAIEDGSGATATDAVYVSGVLQGVAEDGSLVPVALVDMVGGL